MAFVVGPRQGSFAGMPATRTFRLVVHGDGTPAKTVDLGAVGATGGEFPIP